jgi:predicted metal-dependent hydrolase
MKVRRPSFEFSETPAHWAANPEFAQMFNATSLWIPHLERFLNRVMAKAASEMKGDDPETQRIKSDVRTFIRQEANHYSLHAAFNTILANNGYDVAEFERYFEAEFEKLFKTRSLGFLCAYCEGFETMGPPSALIWLDEMEDMLEGARPEVVRLWKWHLMEEYEHRTVCHDVFHAVHGGYFMRIYGFFVQLRQLTHFSTIVREYLLERDRARMTKDELRASRKRARAANRRLYGLMIPRLLKVLSPFYTPRNAKEPQMFRSYMAEIEAGPGR